MYINGAILHSFVYLAILSPGEQPTLRIQLPSPTAGREFLSCRCMRVSVCVCVYRRGSGGCGGVWKVESTVFELRPSPRR